MKNRITSLVLALSLCASLLVLPAHAEYIYNPMPSDWDVFATAFNNLISDLFGVSPLDHIDYLVFPVTGPVNSLAELDACAEAYNSWRSQFVRTFMATYTDQADYYAIDGTLKRAKAYATPTFVVRDGIYRLCDNATGVMLVDSQGRFPYYEPPADSSTVDPDLSGAQVPATPSISNNHWVGERSLANQVVLITYDSLSECVVNLNNEGYTCSIQKQTINGTTFYVIKDNGRQVYCNSLNQPFASQGESSATDINYDYITNDNSTTITDTQIIDMADGVLNIVNENGEKTQFWIDDINFNFDDHSYTVNAYDYTYNIQNNYYEYNYYTYNITYNISNTYINYIGSTAEFVPTEYELYYELPDGRSSADLTIDEMAGMSFQFYDVINYHKSATDTYLRALYHFDGDTDDSSYFSTQGDFTWTTGASLTYMESGAFDGALYLDTAAHAFDLTLPSNIGSGDFTLQFRYYQASQPDTTSNINNYISVNGSRLMSWDESNFYYGSKGYETTLGPLSIGSWQELAIVRDSGTLYYYHNGLCVGSTSNVSVLGNVLTFNFGTTSRSYSMLDELRVLNFPLAENGASYSCTTVPYDTNLVLVLPGGTYPVADEYWDFQTDGNLLGFQDWTTNTMPSSRWSWYKDIYSNVLTISDGFATFTNNESSPTNIGGSSTGGDGSNCLRGGLSYYIGTYYTQWSNPDFTPVWGNTYTFSVLGRDSQLSSITFTLNRNNKTETITETFDWGQLVYKDYYYNSRHYVSVAIVPTTGQPFDFVYTELKEGSAPNTDHEYVTCIYDSNTLKPNTAAVQTDIPITAYTVGGVRPTFPKRGQVWFTVENKRVQGCYVYTGTAWESVNCRYYTGSRWIPIYAFDMDTLADLWDIADGDNAMVQITTETGFWNWWKAQWLDFRSWLSIHGIGGSGTTVNPTVLPTEPPDPSDPESSGWSFLDLLKALKDGTWKIITGFVSVSFGGVVGIVSGVVKVGDFFDTYKGVETDDILGMEGDVVWD